MSASVSLSIVTTTLNARDLIGRCLENVASRGREAGVPVEHIVIDGGSTDGTVEVLRAYADRHPHVKWISESDRGTPHAANKGSALARHSVLGWLGADDSYTPGAFEAVARGFRKHPAADFLIGGHNVVLNDGTVLRAESSCYTNRRDLVRFWKSWWVTIRLPWQATFFRKSVYDELGPYDERYRSFEYEYYLRAAARGRVLVCVPEILTNFRHDAGSGTFAMAAERQWEKDMLAVSRENWGPPWTLSHLRLALSFSRHDRAREKAGLRRVGQLQYPSRRG